MSEIVLLGLNHKTAPIELRLFAGPNSRRAGIPEKRAGGQRGIALLHLQPGGGPAGHGADSRSRR